MGEYNTATAVAQRVGEDKDDHDISADHVRKSYGHQWCVLTLHFFGIEPRGRRAKGNVLVMG